MTLFNHEVYYHVETEMTSWLNRFIKDKLNEPVEHLSCDDQFGVNSTVQLVSGDVSS